MDRAWVEGEHRAPGGGVEHRALGDSGVRRKSGKQTSGNGDITSLTTEPNRTWNPGNQAPTFQRQTPAQLISLESLEETTCSHVASQSLEAGSRRKPALLTLSFAGDVMSGLPVTSGHLAGRAKGDPGRPRGSHPAPHALINLCNPRSPPCVCV